MQGLHYVSTEYALRNSPFPVIGIVHAGAIIQLSLLLSKTLLFGQIRKLPQRNNSGKYK